MSYRIDDRGDVLYRNTYPALSAFSELFWMYISTDRNTTSVLSYRNDMGTDSQWIMLGMGSDGTTLRVENQSGSVTGTNLSTGTWYHIALVKNSGNFKVYLNGVQDINLDSSASESSINVWCLMSFIQDSGNPFAEYMFNGRLAAYKLYSAVLTQAEVQQEMWQFMPQRTANLYSWLPMVDSIVANLKNDMSGNGNNWSAVTFPTPSPTIESNPPIQWRRGRSRIFVSSGAAPKILDATTSAFTYTAKNLTGLFADRKLNTEVKTYAYTAKDLTGLQVGRKLTANVAAFSETPIDVTFPIARGFAATKATFNYTPIDVILNRGYVLALEKADFTYTSIDLSLDFTRLLSGLTAAFTYTPIDVELIKSGEIDRNMRMFYGFLESLAKSKQNLESDILFVQLLAVEPSQSSDFIETDLPDDLATGYGYDHGGLSVGVATTAAQVNGIFKLCIANKTIIASGGSIGPFRYIALLNNDAVDKDVIGYYDCGSDITINNGNGFTINFDAVNGVVTIQ